MYICEGGILQDELVIVYKEHYHAEEEEDFDEYMYLNKEWDLGEEESDLGYEEDDDNNNNNEEYEDKEE